jgi:hypothetical protein
MSKGRPMFGAVEVSAVGKRLRTSRLHPTAGRPRARTRLRINLNRGLAVDCMVAGVSSKTRLAKAPGLLRKRLIKTRFVGVADALRRR